MWQIIFISIKIKSVFAVTGFNEYFLFTGCMLCLGRSNYFRFNHPQEAKKIKDALPNCRISCTPMDFLQGMLICCLGIMTECSAA